jgi:hypothetical protein
VDIGHTIPVIASRLPREGGADRDPDDPYFDERTTGPSSGGSSIAARTSASLGGIRRTAPPPAGSQS